MSDEHVWEHKRISVWRGAGTCLCVGCIICDNCKYLDVKLCIFIIWRPTYIWINIAQVRRDFTCHNKLMRSDTNGKNWLTVIGNVGHNSTLACAEMILALFKATGSHAWLPHWFQTRRRRTARVYQPIILSKIAIDTENVATSVLRSDDVLRGMAWNMLWQLLLQWNTCGSQCQGQNNSKTSLSLEISGVMKWIGHYSFYVSAQKLRPCALLYSPKIEMSNIKKHTHTHTKT